MGISIHYNGRFSNSTSLSEMIEELKDIAEINKWQYVVYHSNFPKKFYDDNSHNKKLYGIVIFIPNCEPVCMTFLSNRRMCMPIALKIYGNSNNKNEKNYLYLLSTKTQFAGRDVHKMVINLFKHISKKYFSEFELVDDAKYWETGDEKVLDDYFFRYNELLVELILAAHKIPLNSNESVEEYFKRLCRIISKKNKK